MERSKFLRNRFYNRSDLSDLRLHPPGDHDTFPPAAGHHGGHKRFVFPLPNLQFPIRLKICILLNWKGFPGQRGFLDFQIPGFDQPQVGRNLHSRFEQHHIPVGQLCGGNPADLSAPADMRFRACQLFQRIKGFLGLSLLDHPHRRIEHDDNSNDDCVTKFFQ